MKKKDDELTVLPISLLDMSGCNSDTGTLFWIKTTQ